MTKNNLSTKELIAVCRLEDFREVKAIYQYLILLFLKKIKDFPDLTESIMWEENVNFLENSLKEFNKSYQF